MKNPIIWFLAAVLSSIAYILSRYVVEYFRPYQYQKIRVFNRYH